MDSKTTSKTLTMSYVNKLFSVKDEAKEYILWVLNKYGGEYKLIEDYLDEEGCLTDEARDLPRGFIIDDDENYTPHPLVKITLNDRGNLEFEGVAGLSNDGGHGHWYSYYDLEIHEVCEIADLICQLENAKNK